jgi:SAM-dependent methyltransferase
MNYKRLAGAFFRRIKQGNFLSTFYLVYFYIYLLFFDYRWNTSFVKSSHPQPLITGKDGTGNFPIHPAVVRQFLKNSGVPFEAKIIDIGSGSGMALYIMYQAGYRNLCGIELNPEVVAEAKRNLPSDVKIIHENALNLKLDALGAECIFMFNPFRGKTLEAFLKSLPVKVRTVIAINCDPLLSRVLMEKNYKIAHTYRHMLYGNFSGQIWKLNNEI